MDKRLNTKDIDEEDNIKQRHITSDEAKSRIDEQTAKRTKQEKLKTKVLHGLGFGDVEERKEDLYLLY